MIKLWKMKIMIYSQCHVEQQKHCHCHFSKDMTCSYINRHHKVIESINWLQEPDKKNVKDYKFLGEVSNI